jgi:hypothetical protein
MTAIDRPPDASRPPQKPVDREVAVFLRDLLRRC